MSVQQSNNNSSKIFWLNFISGGVAGAISKTVAAPIERVKLILQTEAENKKITKRYKGIVDCFSRCIKEEGFMSLWRGNWANVIRYFPTQALNFSFKEYASKLLKVNESQSNKSLFMFKSIMSGGIAGCWTMLIVYPLDFARTRLGVDMGRTHSERSFTGLFDLIGKVYKSDGIMGLYQGINPCLFGIFIYRGLYFGIYDAGKKIILSKESEKSIIQRFLFANFVVIFSETISYPTDTIKRKMMMQSARKELLYKNSIDCTKKIYEKEGINGFFRGNVSNMIRSVGSSLCLVLFDELQKLWMPTNQAE